MSDGSQRFELVGVVVGADGGKQGRKVSVSRPKEGAPHPLRLCDFATLRLPKPPAPFPNYDSARMDLTWALEDVARTSDDAVVRRRFAERNRVWLVVFLLFFAFVSLLEATTNQRTNTPFDVLVATANFALCAFGLFLMARQRMAAEEHERNDRRVHRGAVRAAPALSRTGDNWVVRRWRCRS